jgi:hypothetical protein
MPGHQYLRAIARPDGDDARLVIDGIFGGQHGKLAFAAGSAGATRARR